MVLLVTNSGYSSIFIDNNYIYIKVVLIVLDSLFSCTVTLADVSNCLIGAVLVLSEGILPKRYKQNSAIQYS